MDLLRSCYTTQMRFTPGGEPQRVRWYFCPPGARLFPGEHSFSSLNWTKQDTLPDEDDGAIGEVIGARRTYGKGKAPAGVTGQSVCGPVDWYREGAPLTAPPLERRADGLAICCLPGGFRGGIGMGGRGRVAFGQILPGTELLGVYTRHEVGPVLLWTTPERGIGMAGVSECSFMAETVSMSAVKIGRILVLQAAFGVRANFVTIASPSLHLYTNDPELSYEMTPLDFTEPGGAWYAPQMVAWTTLFNLLGDQSYALRRGTNPDFVGAAGAADSVVQGWYAMWNGSWIAAQRFDSAVDMGFAGPGLPILSLFPEIRFTSTG